MEVYEPRAFSLNFRAIDAEQTSLQSPYTTGSKSELYDDAGSRESRGEAATAADHVCASRRRRPLITYLTSRHDFLEMHSGGEGRVPGAGSAAPAVRRDFNVKNDQYARPGDVKFRQLPPGSGSGEGILTYLNTPALLDQYRSRGDIMTAPIARCGWESLMKSVTLGNVTMSQRERPAECRVSPSTMIGLPRAH
ncbi:hypothetical protein EVAR_18735_1 [Eumeta japonica]|uniref:Uncharacterized protein n=1 Tax=Eumeta variegata TaxID=151549 RepID=A0A4C1UNJ4_EUMVA|nr:hypothetical protein EVAR_18735_1 [Eumeta japonica]